MNFQKVYDLAERVIPGEHHESEVEHTQFVDWPAGRRSPGWVLHPWRNRRLFDLVTPQEARDWVKSHRDELCEVSLLASDGGAARPSYAFADFSADVANLPEPSSRVRVLSPFDPLLRDRNRTERLFGFYYRIEVFVPEPKRQYGYYVFPLLEGDRLIGRIDMKADRKRSTLDVRRLWLEPGVRASAGRLEKLDAELSRLAKFTGWRV